jgi:crotonobetaine/carnitine-CoA ligase
VLADRHGAWEVARHLKEPCETPASVDHTGRNDRSGGYANGFRALGIGKGDHVAVMLPNCPEFIWTIWGLAKLGAVAVPLNTAARGELLRYFITQSDSIAAVVAAEWAARMAEALGGEHKVGFFLTLGGGEAELAALGRPVGDLAAAAKTSPTTTDRDAARASYRHFMMYTLGTTGCYKGVISPHSQAHGVGRSLAQNFGYRPDDVRTPACRCFTATRSGTGLCGLVGRRSARVSPRFSASGFWDGSGRAAPPSSTRWAR